MTATDLGSHTEFVSELRKYHLLRDEHLPCLADHLLAFPERTQAELLGFLVKQKVLSTFQADVIEQGRGKELLLSQFILTDVIGNGCMGTVFKARAVDVDAWYAIRTVPRRNVMSLETIAEKVKAFREIRHPRVSALVSIGKQGDRVYLVWPFLDDGEKLDEVVKKHGKLSARQTLQVGTQVGLGLQAYHQRGLYHGLLKPSDILIGSDRRVRILDFGVGFLLASERGKSLLDTMTNTKALARGLDCASPESILDTLARTPAGDQYSLGCVLYYCLTGQFPFPMVNPVKKMLAHQNDEPQPIQQLSPEVSPRLIAIVQHLMRKKPEERYPDMEAVLEALQAINPSAARQNKAGSNVTGERPSDLTQTPGPEKSLNESGFVKPRKVEPRRRDSLIPLTLAAALIVGVVLGWWISRM